MIDTAKLSNPSTIIRTFAVRSIPWFATFTTACHITANVFANTVVIVGSPTPVEGPLAPILRTTDDGQSWHLHPSSFSELRDVHFTDERNGFIAGANSPPSGTILQTSTWGITWPTSVNETGTRLHAIDFVDSDNGWAAGNLGRVFKTSDGGANWTSVYVGESRGLNTVDFIDTNTGWIGGDRSFIARTNDGGDTWAIQTVNLSHPVITDLQFLDTNNGWAVTTSGQVLHTIDGGTTWDVQSHIGFYQGLHFVDMTNGWVVGQSRDAVREGIIVRTDDGGITWTTQSRGEAEILFDIDFLDHNLGWAVGQEGVILRTVDGGENWIQQPTGVRNRLNAIAIIPNLPGDFDRNNYVGAQDLNLVLFNWDKPWDTLPLAWKADVPSINVGTAELNANLFNWTRGSSPSVPVPEAASIYGAIIGLLGVSFFWPALSNTCSRNSCVV